MSKNICKTERDVDFQRKKKAKRKQLLERLQEKIHRQEMEQIDWEREMGFNND